LKEQFAPRKSINNMNVKINAIRPNTAMLIAKKKFTDKKQLEKKYSCKSLNPQNESMLYETISLSSESIIVEKYNNPNGKVVKRKKIIKNNLNLNKKIEDINSRLDRLTLKSKQNWNISFVKDIEEDLQRKFSLVSLKNIKHNVNVEKQIDDKLVKDVKFSEKYNL